MKDTLPCDIEAEKAILGVILLDNSMIHIAGIYIASDDFYLSANGIIYKTISRMVADKFTADLITVKSELQKDGNLDDSGGIAYLASLTDGISKTENIEYYAKIVKEKSLLRKTAKACQETLTLCCQESGTHADIAEKHIKTIRNLSGEVKTGFHTGLKSVSDAFNLIEKRFGDKRRITGIPSGIESLDLITTGFHNGDTIVISAKTGHGKTALALNILTHAIMYYHAKAIVYSLEMSREQLCTRMIAAHSGVDSYQLRTGYIRNADWGAITNSSSVLSECDWWIHDKSITIGELDTRTRRVADESGVDIIFVDYLQLVTLGNGRKIENRTQEVTEISRSLKAIAVDLNIPVIALSQENEQGELRESRAIEHDASLFISIEMEKKDLKTMDDVPAIIHVRKNRNGSLADVPVIFQKRFTRFVGQQRTL